MHYESINIFIMSILGFFLIAFFFVMFASLLVLSSMSNELDKLIKEDHDSAVW